MKSILIATAIATSLAGTAYSGALEFIPAVDAEMISPITDWSGPYAGGMAAMSTGLITEVFDFSAFNIIVPTQTRTAAIPTPRVALISESSYDVDGNMFGAFAGYNFQRGAIVYGIEGAYSAGSVRLDDSILSKWDYEFTSIIDVKARVGFAAGNALIYGFAGGTASELTFTARSEEYLSPTGYNYGAGIDLMVTDKVFLGAEYIVRELSDDTDEFRNIDATLQSVQIRAGMTF
jgi:opacity protein-like surface antigen